MEGERRQAKLGNASSDAREISHSSVVEDERCFVVAGLLNTNSTTAGLESEMQPEKVGDRLGATVTARDGTSSLLSLPQILPSAGTPCCLKFAYGFRILLRKQSSL